jgi:hypothetical protein
MRSFRIRDALADSSWGIEPGGMVHPAFVQCIYIVREEHDVFYVGMTGSDFGSRLRWHLALERKGSYRLSPLGECIIANWPASLAWEIELWKAEEIQQEIAPPELRANQPFGVREAERCAIRHFRPPLNFAGREYLEGSRLPPRYIKCRR